MGMEYPPRGQRNGSKFAKNEIRFFFLPCQKALAWWYKEVLLCVAWIKKATWEWWPTPHKSKQDYNSDEHVHSSIPLMGKRYRWNA